MTGVRHHSEAEQSDVLDARQAKLDAQDEEVDHRQEVARHRKEAE
jgi:hypothetical protein